MMATTKRRLSLTHVVPTVLAITSVGLTAWANQAADGKKADKKPTAKATATAQVTTKAADPAKATANAPASAAAKSTTKAQAPAKDNPPAAAKPEPKPEPKPAVVAKPETKPAEPARLSVANAALAKQIRDAKKTYAAGDDGREAKARADLQAALAKLDARLSADGQNGADWKKFLMFEELQAELKKKSDVDLTALAQIERRYSAGYLGLEEADYRDVAAALDDFAAAAAVAQTKDLKQDYEQTLEALAAAVETAGDAGPNSTQAVAIGRLVNHLEQFGQADAVVHAVTKRYSQPNLLVDLSQSFTDESLIQPIDRTEPVTDCILGTAISGCGRTVGDVRLDFVPSDDRAVVYALMNGVNNAQTVGQNRSALIYSNGRTALSGHQTLYLTDEGLAAGPVKASAQVSSRFTGFGSTKRGIVGKIVARIAAKKAPKQKAQATAIAQAHAKQRLIASLNKDVNQLVAKSREQWQTKIRLPLRRFDIEPQELQFTTTDDALRLRVVQAGRGRLGAPSAPPKIAGNAGLAVRVHTSLIDNGAQQAIAGRKFDRDRIDDLLRNQLGLKLKDRNELDEVPFSITFAEQDPVTVVFDDDRVSVTIRAASFTSDDKVLEAMDITAHYTLTADKNGLTLTREGDFEIYPPGFVRGGAKKLSLAQTSLRTLLKKRFDKMLPVEFKPEGVVLDAGRGTLYVGHVKSDDGWLSLGLEVRKEPNSAE